eukprot:CAMPEP_0119332902 /NCGR_PEP_ID=MMETSP1333-20130426/83857_1 /TAXON_ID=418940 /ORGANISM="Scyphosphaera apsteinii, Strain RCC1455" /LENGTH=192 /DNA_ID=CAMNT_0007342821 /DNA_START=187 /DNA_END=765 /DNA_ORIENTATION=-
MTRRLLSAAKAATPTSLRLLSATEVSELTESSARELILKLPTGDGQQMRQHRAFIVRGTDGQVRLFENHCPHAGGPLNWLPDRFFTRDGKFLLCTRHAAMFSPDDGVCVSGPCVGESLLPIAVEFDGNGGVLVPLEVLETLAHDGGGGFTLEPLDGPAVPSVSRPEPFVPRRLKRKQRPDKNSMHLKERSSK